jgi:HK97 family phage major capsid protein
MDPKDMQKLFARAAKFGIDSEKVAGLDMTSEPSARAALDALIVEKQEADLASERKAVIELKSRKPDAPVAAKVAPIGGNVEIENKVLRRYSVMNAVRALSGMKVDAGFEREISDECARLRGKPAEGLIIPFTALAMRDLTVAGTSSASVATSLYSDQFVDLLRTKYILGQAGVQFLTGLVGDVAIPKMTAGATGYWVAEGADVTESTPTLGQATGTPHTAGALVDISRKLMIQSTPDAETMVRNEIVERVMRTIQIAVFAGTGADGQPSAITNATGINNPSVTQGTPTYAEILGFPGAVMADSAESDGQKFLMTAEVWAKLAATLVGADGARTVLDPFTKKCIGYDYLQTEDLPANSLWFGNWASVVVGIWGNGVDVAMTDSKLFASGGVTLRALQDVDVMVRLGQALAYNVAVTN